jgi:hypothetical protein
MFFQQTKTVGLHYIADEINGTVIITWNLGAFYNQIGNDTSYSNGHVFRATAITSKEVIR